MSELMLTVEGIKGGKPKNIGKKASATLLIDEEFTHSRRIYVDAFQGTGANYEEMDSCNIQIYDKGKMVFFGSFDDLVKKLSP